jgi:two-component system phosphate regulon sensor histidine kinase PhoR
LGLRVTFVRADGTVLADSSRTPTGVAAMDDHSGRPEIRAALETGSGESERRSATVGQRYFYRAVRVEGSGPVDIVRIALPMSEIEATQTRLIRLAVLVAVAVLGILVVISYVSVRRLSRRIERVADVAERTSQGDLTVEMEIPGEDEIGRLASSLHRMKQNLLVQVQDVENERRLLASIVSGIQEGLILVGHDLRVRTANESFRRIFQVPFDPTGRLLAEIIRFPSVIHRLEGVLRGGPDVREMVIRSPDTGRSFELHATPVVPEQVSGERWVLALFFDITRLEALENVRQEFVANVSHELRTPLTSIRAFVETLLEGGMDDRANREKFLQVIQRQSAHMQELIDDLTDLSRIETGAIELERESLDLADVTRDVLARVRDRHPDAGVDLLRDFPGPVRGRFDRRRMEQVLVNLVENAVKFNRAGGHVTVRGRLDRGRIRIEVEDDGIGIPSESLPKIFNRFYRVDKARSKEVPGTGLGLAIVKHLVRLHGGTVRVRSELGRGSTFTMDFSTGPAGIE